MSAHSSIPATEAFMNQMTHHLNVVPSVRRPIQVFRGEAGTSTQMKKRDNDDSNLGDNTSNFDIYKLDPAECNMDCDPCEVRTLSP